MTTLQVSRRKALPKIGKFLIPIGFALCTPFVNAAPSDAFSFSLLAWEAEQTVKNCILTETTEFDPAINLGFWGARAVIFVLFMWNLVKGGVKKNNGMDGGDNFSIVYKILAAIAVVGFIEPVFADSTCGGGGGGDDGGGEEARIFEQTPALDPRFAMKIFSIYG